MKAYSAEDRERIVWSVFLLMNEGKSLRKACDQEGISEATVLRWIDQDESGEWSKQYTRARDGLISFHAAEIVRLADDLTKPGNDAPLSSEAVAAAKLQIYARQWTLARLAPKRFGDKVTSEHVGPGGGPVQHQMVERRIVDPEN